jgi:hypothetical protein
VPQHITSLRTIVLHHSASSRDGTTLKRIDTWHRDRGFIRVGYHYVIEGDGTIRYGRPLEMIPAAQLGRNRGTIAVCVTGNNLRDTEQWSAVQRSSVRHLVRSIRTVLGRPLPVLGHRDVADPDHPTECPGVSVEEVFPDLAPDA